MLIKKALNNIEPICEGCGDKHPTIAIWIKHDQCECNDDPYASACIYCLCMRNINTSYKKPYDFKLDSEITK